MSGAWAWHTRTWIADGMVHQQAAVGVGWYVVMLAVLIATSITAAVTR